MSTTIRWVRVKRGLLTHYAGHTGLVVQVDDRGKTGTSSYLVRFADGRECWFARYQLVVISGPPAE